MSKQIDRAGTFTGVVTESTLGQSSGSFPQWVARFSALKKWVNTPEEMAHFGITEPGYVDWSGYDEDILSYLVLFTDKGALKNYEQVMAATGWAGDDFQTLGDLVGKELLYRVEENNYKDKLTFQVNWIDAVDAPPERTLKSVDAATATALNSKFLANMKKPTPPAKPVAAAAKGAASKPPVAKPATVAASPAAAPAAASTPAAPAAVTPSPTTAAPAAAPAETGKAKSSPPRKSTKTPPPPAPTTEAPPTGLPEETTKDSAWEYLNDPAVMGDNDAAVVTDAWIAACNEVGENVAEDAFTPVMWAKVRNIVIKDLNLSAAK